MSHHAAARSALDLGTGCGVVSLILCRLFEVPEIIASDVSFNAVYGAQEELKRHHLQEVEVIHSEALKNGKSNWGAVIILLDIYSFYSVILVVDKNINWL